MTVENHKEPNVYVVGLKTEVDVHRKKNRETGEKHSCGQHT